MRAWRLVADSFAARPFDGEGAARYAGRWNPRGTRMVYTADSLALATLELSVHLTGARVEYVAIEIDVPDRLIDSLDVADLARRWRDDDSVTQRLGGTWAASFTSLGLRVPSVLIDARSDECNLLLNPAHPQHEAIEEIQRFGVVLDERL